MTLEVLLDEFMVVGRDYLKGAGLSNNFNELWTKFSKYTTISERNLRQSMSKEEAKQLAIKMFSIKVQS